MLCAVLFTPLALLDPQATTGHSRDRIEGGTGQLAAARASHQCSCGPLWGWGLPGPGLCCLTTAGPPAPRPCPPRAAQSLNQMVPALSGHTGTDYTPVMPKSYSQDDSMYICFHSVGTSCCGWHLWSPLLTKRKTKATTAASSTTLNKICYIKIRTTVASVLLAMWSCFWGYQDKVFRGWDQNVLLSENILKTLMKKKLSFLSLSVLFSFHAF